MSEQSWVLRGIDPETRQRAEQEAARSGMSLADYVANVVLQRALLEQAPDNAADDARPAADAETAPQNTDNFFVRHRLEAVGRRLGAAAGEFDGPGQALDKTVANLAQRLDETETLTAETADTLNQALSEVSATMQTMRKRISNAEALAGALGEAHVATRTDLGRRCETIEQQLGAIANSADDAHDRIAELSEAQDQLKYAVADDFSAFAQDSMARLNTGLDEVRAAADNAAKQADAAATHLITELRAMREAIDARVGEGQEQTRQRIQAAVAETTHRINGLAERVAKTERLAQRSAEQLRAQISDVEDAAQTALEETAESLRQAGASLAAEVARTTRDSRTALESVHADLSKEIAELRERQAGGLARLKQIDAAANASVADVAKLREQLQRGLAQAEQQAHAALNETHTDVSSRLAALNARLAQAELTANEADLALQADVERVEACTLAALEKQAQERSAGHATAIARIQDLQRRLETHQAAQDAFQNGALVRLKLLESTTPESAELNARLGQIENDLANRAIDRGFDERLVRLEALAESTHTEQALAALRGQIAGLAAQVDAAREDQSVMQLVEDLRVRIDRADAQVAGADERVQDLTRMLSHLGAQQADAASKTEQRLLRLEAEASTPRGVDTSALDQVEQRMAAMERRQAQAFEAMRADIEAFVADNARRLETLEAAAEAPPYDIASEFQELRQRIEDRVLGVEQRSVRALEQLAETMEVLEQRFNNGDGHGTAKSA